MALLSIDRLSKRYGETTALADVSIDFEAGTIHTILGENGSGKSTLVKLLSGIVHADQGWIAMDGRRLDVSSPRRVQDQGIATVFQEVLIAPDRSVTDNVLLGYDGLLSRRVSRNTRRAEAQRALGLFAKAALPMETPAGQLPLAHQQLIVIARAAIRKPRVLILDEATAALDFADREGVFNFVKQLAERNVLVLFISHRMDEIMRLSQQITVLRGGRCVATIPRAEADPDRLLRLMAPEVVAARAHG